MSVTAEADCWLCTLFDEPEELEELEEFAAIDRP